MLRSPVGRFSKLVPVHIDYHTDQGKKQHRRYQQNQYAVGQSFFCACPRRGGAGVAHRAALGIQNRWPKAKSEGKSQKAKSKRQKCKLPGLRPSRLKDWYRVKRHGIRDFASVVLGASAILALGFRLLPFAFCILPFDLQCQPAHCLRAEHDPRRGSISLAVGETHGYNKVPDRPRRGEDPCSNPQRELSAYTKYQPASGFGKFSAALFPSWVSPTANDIRPLRGPNVLPAGRRLSWSARERRKSRGPKEQVRATSSYLPTALCLPRSAYCFLPTAYCFLPTAFSSSAASYAKAADCREERHSSAQSQ